jgi:hypothetical protein
MERSDGMDAQGESVNALRRQKRIEGPSWRMATIFEKWDLKKPQPESTGSIIKTYRKSTGLEITQRIARSTVGLQRIKDWTLWKGRPPQKWKEKQQVEWKLVM